MAKPEKDNSYQDYLEDAIGRYQRHWLAILWIANADDFTFDKAFKVLQLVFQPDAKS